VRVHKGERKGCSRQEGKKKRGSKRRLSKAKRGHRGKYKGKPGLTYHPGKERGTGKGEAAIPAFRNQGSQIDHWIDWFRVKTAVQSHNL